MSVQRMHDNAVLVGPTRSRIEVSMWLGNEVSCPECGDGRMIPIPSDWLPPGDPLAVRVGATCLGCGQLSKFAFTPGPGWGDEPALDDPRLALTDAPSQILPEAMFSRWIDEGLAELDRSEGFDPARPDQAVWVQDAARRGLAAVSELRKLRRAAGGDSSDAERAAGRRFAEAWVATGGAVPPGLAWITEVP